MPYLLPSAVVLTPVSWCRLYRLLGLTDPPPPYLENVHPGSYYRVSLETDAVFFRIDLSYLVSELWAFELFDFIKGFGLGKILPLSNVYTKFFLAHFI